MLDGRSVNGSRRVSGGRWKVGVVELRVDHDGMGCSGAGLDAISKMKVAEFLLISGGYFFHFWAIFTRFGQFWSIFGVDFSVFLFFSTFRYGILAPRTRPCTIGHRKQVLRYNVW
jgi:hypothetical protein